MTLVQNRAHIATRQSPTKTEILTFVLYCATLTVDAVRKVLGLPGSALGVVYLVVCVIYLVRLPVARKRLGAAPVMLPVWLVLLSGWCVIEAVVQRVPVGMGVLGWFSYVFFVPLLYVGAELMSTDRGAARALRVVVVAGGVVGLGAVLSAVLGQSAPTILTPLVPSAGVHSFYSENIYLAPSIFATAEEAAEALLIALFAWIALSHLRDGRLGRTSSSVIIVLIVTGMVAAERRADIVVAIVGVIALLLITPFTSPRTAHERAPRTAAATRGRFGTALILGATGVIVLLTFLDASQIVPFLASAANGQNAVSFMLSPTNPGSLTGQGTGTSTQGITVVGATTFGGVDNGGTYTGYTLNGRSFMTIEGGLTKTWLELGIVGVVLYGGVFFSALAPLLLAVRRLDGVGRALAVLTVALGIIFLKGHQSLDDPLIQPFFWLAAGGVWGRMRRDG